MSVITRNSGAIRETNKWQMCIMRYYKFYESQVWDLACFGKEATIRHKVITVNEWRACIAPACISKQCGFFCLPTISESIKHNFWDCIQARCAWWWPTFNMSSMELGRETMIVFIGSKPSLGKEVLRNLLRNQDLKPPLWYDPLDNLA